MRAIQRGLAVGASALWGVVSVDAFETMYGVYGEAGPVEYLAVSGGLTLALIAGLSLLMVMLEDMEGDD